jgi:hypothetical protein
MTILIVSFVAVVVLIFLYQFLKLNRVVKQQPNGPSGAPNAELLTQLSFDNDAITVKYPDGGMVLLRWSDLTMVGIALVKDPQSGALGIYWGLHAGKSVPAITYPHGAIGDKELLAEFAKRLPNFDMNKVMTAVGGSRSENIKIWLRA